MISEPTPKDGNPDSTHNMWPVFFTDLTMASTSRGFIDRRLMTSASTPYRFFSSSAATSDWPTHRERVTMVRSLPGRSILALPNCISSVCATRARQSEEGPYGDDEV